MENGLLTTSLVGSKPKLNVRFSKQHYWQDSFATPLRSFSLRVTAQTGDLDLQFADQDASSVIISVNGRRFRPDRQGESYTENGTEMAFVFKNQYEMTELWAEAGTARITIEYTRNGDTSSVSTMMDPLPFDELQKQVTLRGDELLRAAENGQCKPDIDFSEPPKGSLFD